jgi:GDPmannose 4,6-dehydratase
MTTTSEAVASGRRRALITGVTGQDGSYLSQLLLDKGYEVIGTSRDAAATRRDGLAALGIEQRVKVVSMSPTDFRSVLRVVMQHEPDEIYHLAGQTSVGLSFEQPVEAIESIALGVLNLLEAMRFYGQPVRLYNAGSSECFGQGESGTARANELTPFRPRSPYAVAKVCAHNLVANYREAYGMYACNGILFNHESPLRGETFVTRKITRAIARIALGLQDCLYLGNLGALRDWGHARDYVEMQWLMLQQQHPQDFVIATGVQHSVREFVVSAARELGVLLEFTGDGEQETGRVVRVSGERLQCRQGDVVVRVDPRFFRPTDVQSLQGDAAKACEMLGWTPRTGFEQLVHEMIKRDYEAAQREAREQVVGQPPQSDAVR